MKLKKMIALAMGVIMALSLAACKGNVEIPDPFTEHKALTDGVTLKGGNDAFSLAIWEKDGYTYSISADGALALPDLLQGSDDPNGPGVLAPGNGILQVDSAAELSEKVGFEDVSGDFDDYKNVTELSLGNTAITLKGNGGAYTLAVWTDGGYSCSIALSGGATAAEWRTILRQRAA